MPDGDSDAAVHPEDFCQSCGRPNPAWWTDSAGWNVATENVPLGRAAILCPSCFVTAWEAATGDSAVWRLVPTSGEAERDRLRALLALAETHVSNGSSLRQQIREALSGVATTTEPGGRHADGQ